MSYALVEEAFENHQNKWPEAVFNEDSWFKYLQPLADDGDASYLSMLQGSKAEQRKWWLYNRFRYIDSKYNAGDALTDVITLRGYAKSDVVVTPYADVYATVKYGSYLVQARAERNQSYTLYCPLDEVNDTEIYIYSASQLASVGDLSGFKVGYANFSMATKLQELKIGDSSINYSNGNLTELYLGNNTLLRSIDVRNCTNLAMPVDISGCSNIEHVYFNGTAITGLSLPNGGILKTLQLPDTITNLTIRNQPSLTTFTIPTGSNITTLRLENVGNAVDSKSILSNLAANSRVRLIGFSWTFENYAAAAAMYDKLDTMRGLSENGGNMDNAQMMGTIHIPTLTGAQMASLNERYPDITVTFENLTSNLYYYNGTGDTLLYTETIVNGADGTYAGTPSKSQDAQYSYTFIGWATKANQWTANANAMLHVTADRNIYAAYSRTVRTYTVLWKNGNTTLETDTDVPYGTTPTYDGATPVSSEEDYEFSGWSPSVGPITGDTTYLAAYIDVSSDLVKYLKGTLTSYNSDTATTVGQYAFYNRTNLTNVRTSATTIGNNAFYNCSNLATVDFTTTDSITIVVGSLSNTYSILNYTIRSNSPNTYAINALSTPFIYGLGIVYVPDDLVSSYKEFSANDSFARFNKIHSIDEYPVTDFSTISDSWNDIIDSIENDTYLTKYSVGDTKKISVGNVELYMQLIAMNLDELSNGTGTAKTTWLCFNVEFTHRMSSNAGVYHWEQSEMRSWLISDILPAIPSEIRQAIKEVKKTYYNSSSSTTSTSNDKIWIPSMYEIHTSPNYVRANNGVRYTWFINNGFRMKYKGNTRINWHTRSYVTEGRVMGINMDGAPISSNNYATTEYGVVFGFCI